MTAQYTTDIDLLREQAITLETQGVNDCAICGVLVSRRIDFSSESMERRFSICEPCLVEAWRLLGRLQVAPFEAYTVKVPSETRPSAAPYRVFTGDGGLAPAHCTCFAFQYHERRAGEQYMCKHLRHVLRGEGMS